MRNNDPVNESLRDTAWRRALSQDEARRLEGWLAAHPDERAGWDEERALTRLLTRLPDAAAPSNLTSRVLAAIDEPATARGQRTVSSWLGWLRSMGWVPRLSGVAVLVMAGLLGHHQYQLHREAEVQRTEMAHRVATVSELAETAPSVEILQDFDSIRNLPTTAGPDEALLAALR